VAESSTTVTAGSTRAPACSLLQPRWSAPGRVRAAFTLRQGGASVPPYDSLNLGAHVGDDARAVAENRAYVTRALALPAEPLWLAQQHGTSVVDAEPLSPVPTAPPQADAAITHSPGRVLAVLVADCLPVLFARSDGSAIAVAHAGWRGLAAGVLEAAVAALGGDPEQIHAWIGPAICSDHFEVGAEVRDAFCRRHAHAASGFVPNAQGRWQCDLYALARQRLAGAGVRYVTAEARCTYGEAALFYSFRRDGMTGRMAALIWLQP
jgi:YfiH family protein